MTSIMYSLSSLIDDKAPVLTPSRTTLPTHTLTWLRHFANNSGFVSETFISCKKILLSRIGASELGPDGIPIISDLVEASEIW